MRTKKRLCIALVLLGLLAAGSSALWASGTWLYPVPSGTGLGTPGDLVYFADLSHLTNLSSTVTGRVLCSTGAGAPPIWCTNPVLTGATLASPTISTPTITGGTLASAAITGGTLTSAAITGGTIASAAITGGTVASATLTGATIVSPLISTPTITGSVTLATATLQTVAPAGPGAAGGIVLRARPSNKSIGACALVAAGGNSYNQEVTIIDPIPSGPGGC